jgi:hypothetical protein
VEGLIEGIDARGKRVAGEVPTGRDSIPVRGLVEVDLSLGRSSSGGGARGAMGEVEMSEDAVDDGGIGEEGEDTQGAVASRAAQRVELVDASEELGPAEAGGAGGSRRRVGASVGGRLGGGVEFVEAAEFVVGPCEADDVGAPACVGGQDAVVAVAMRAGRGDQPGESLEELERSEPQGRSAAG